MAVIDRLQARAGRPAASSPIEPPRHRGVEVAVGGAGHLSHVEGAAAGACCVILVTSAPTDGREIGFDHPRSVVEGQETSRPDLPPPLGGLRKPSP